MPLPPSSGGTAPPPDDVEGDESADRVMNGWEAEVEDGPGVVDDAAVDDAAVGEDAEATAESAAALAGASHGVPDEAGALGVESKSSVASSSVSTSSLNSSTSTVVSSGSGSNALSTPLSTPASRSSPGTKAGSSSKVIKSGNGSVVADDRDSVEPANVASDGADHASVGDAETGDSPGCVAKEPSVGADQASSACESEGVVNGNSSDRSIVGTVHGSSPGLSSEISVEPGKGVAKEAALGVAQGSSGVSLLESSEGSEEDAANEAAAGVAHGSSGASSSGIDDDVPCTEGANGSNMR